MNIKVVRIVIIALAAVVLIAVIGIKVLTSAGGSKYGLSVQHCSGNVNISSDGKIAPASLDTKLKEGDSVLVGEGGLAILAYRVKGSDNDIQISLDSGTDFLVGENFDGKSKKDAAKASVGNGEAVVNALDNDATVSVATSNAAFSVSNAVGIIKADAAANVNEGYTLKNVVRVQYISYAGTPTGPSYPLEEKMYTQVVNTAEGPAFAAHDAIQLNKLSANTLNTLLVTAFDAQDELAFSSNDLMNAYNAALAGTPATSAPVPDTTPLPTETTTVTLPEVTTPTPPPTTKAPVTTAPPVTTTKGPTTTAAPVTTTTAKPTTTVPTTTTVTTTATTANQKTYNVTFMADGKSTVIPVKHGGSVTPPTPPEKKGYSFKQWDKPTTNITQDCTITAIYEEKLLTVRLVAGSTYVEQKVKYGKDVDLNAIPKYEVNGKIIGGWDKPTTNITSDCTITAYLIDKNAKQYTVTFVIGNARYTAKVSEGGTAVCPVTVPESVGHTFMYWDKALTNIRSDTVITAIYSDTKYYTVTFISEGTVISTQNVLSGMSATPPSITNAPSGKRFKGWSGNYTNITGNVTVYAEYESTQTYAVTFILTNADGSTVVVSNQQISAGGTATLPTINIPAGQTFTGWSGNYTNVQGNVVITGALKADSSSGVQYTVTYYNSDGSVYYTQQYTQGQSLIYPPTPPAPAGMKFASWNGPTSTQQVNSNITFVAVFTVA